MSVNREPSAAEERLVRGAVSAVLDDFFGAEEPPANVQILATASPGEWDVVVTFAPDFSSGFGVDALDRDRLLAAVADGLQTAFIEGTQVAVPLCPGHQHPMAVDFDAHGSNWVCPGTGETRFAIGEVNRPPPDAQRRPG